MSVTLDGVGPLRRQEVQTEENTQRGQNRGSSAKRPHLWCRSPAENNEQTRQRRGASTHGAQKREKKAESAQIHTRVPSVTADHKTTFEMDSPAWPQLRSETGPSGAKAAPAPRRPPVFNLLQSPRPSGSFLKQHMVWCNHVFMWNTHLTHVKKSRSLIYRMDKFQSGVELFNGYRTFTRGLRGSQFYFLLLSSVEFWEWLLASVPKTCDFLRIRTCF